MSELLNDKQQGVVFSIAELISKANDSALTRDGLIIKASELMYSMLGNTPNYEILKEAQALIENTLVNEHEFAPKTCANYMTEIMKLITLKHTEFKKPSSPNADAKRMSAKREAIKKEFEHVAIETIVDELAQVALRKGKEADARLSILREAKKQKESKEAEAQNTLNKANIDKYRKEIEGKLKNDDGKTWSLNKLQFASLCLENEAQVSKFLKTLKA